MLDKLSKLEQRGSTRASARIGPPPFLKSAHISKSHKGAKCIFINALDLTWITLVIFDEGLSLRLRSLLSIKKSHKSHKGAKFNMKLAKKREGSTRASARIGPLLF